MPAKAKAAAPETIDLEYHLAELPSSQHRAGLAGLVLMIGWLKKQRNLKGICEVVHIDERGAKIRLDQDGLEALFDEVYEASWKKQEASKSEDSSNTEKDEKEWLTLKGAFLVEYDRTYRGDDGVWVKLWRDMVMRTFRPRSTQQEPLKARAAGKHTKYGTDTWESLINPKADKVKSKSTFFLGVEEQNAENVPFQDKAKTFFLLHFWTFVTGIYVPTVINREGKSKPAGFALAVPDVSELKTFTEELPRVWRERGVELAGYRPRDAVVDLAVQGALDMLSRLRERVAARTGANALRFLVLGVDVIHVEKQGNNIRLRGQMRVDPEADVVGEYEKLRGVLWNPLFRRQRLLNLVNKREWYAGFDKLLATLPHKELLAEKEVGFKYFSRDARITFEEEFRLSPQEDSMTEITETIADDATPTLPPEISCEALIYKIVGTYISRKLKSKHDLEWSKASANDEKRKEYEERKAKIAREAFLAVRSRTGADFIDYFASTLCSVPQYMNEKHFQMLTQALHNDTDKVRTLTMLALSARG